jgi:NAD+ diphosphatase
MSPKSLSLVKEELGIEVTDLEYFASQIWPFPDSFMIAFKARFLKNTVNHDIIKLSSKCL